MCAPLATLFVRVLTIAFAIASSFKIIASVVALYTNWELITPRVAPGSPNPFAPFIFISHRIESSPPDDPRYAKGYLDLVFIASYIVFFSFVRQLFVLHIFRPFARWYGIKKAKFDRFGEQGYSIVYWGAMAVWGYLIMERLPTYWYNTEAFWIGYPHWEMKPQLKLYYLMQTSYWTQQLLILVLRLEKPRKDYYELVCHHFVTIWLVGWSYLVNMTLIGNAVFLSMDLPDTALALSKVLNYMQREVAKVFAFAGLIVAWSYFRIYLNLKMLWSVLFEFDLIPAEAKQWAPETGAWLVWWMKYQMFAPLLLLQFLNLFWYFLILRIAFRALWTGDPDDDRSDDEDDGERATEKKK